jgi:hypothetical protein
MMFFAIAGLTIALCTALELRSVNDRLEELERRLR